MSRVSINKLFFETCLACYKDDISNSIYFVGPMGTMFTALKSLFTIINLSTGNLKPDKISLCKTPAQIKSSKKYLPDSTVVNLNTFNPKHFLSIRNLYVLARFFVLSMTLTIKLRYLGILLPKQKRSFINELSFSMEIAAAVVCLRYGKIFKDKSIEVVLCSDHNAFFITLCLLSNSGGFSFLPHGPNIGADNEFRKKNIFNKIYCVFLLQLESFKGWEPKNQYIELKADAKNWKIMSAQRSKGGHDGLVIWFTQLDFFENEYLTTKSVLRKILVKHSKTSNEINVVVKGIPYKKVQELINVTIKDAKIVFHASFDEYNETCHKPLDRHKKLHVVLNSSVSLDLCHQGLDLILLNHNPLVMDKYVMKFLENTYYEFKSMNENYLSMERLRNEL